ncbi:hypothetical protein [Gemmatimonas sp.]|uniref:DUF4760 domain-containing protein n=1 Tax=Gemmatimonas sp. TaxID=1962908 RepID=UPI0022C99569|nr:hypothetical protein [Gemmatimonas sp.]MCZ8205359.1 hypothetical protein [Gemmatimonas sp.]
MNSSSLLPDASSVPLKDYADHHDADLALKLYDLRREAVMRESRTALVSKFLPASWDDVLAVTKPDHPLNAAFRQCATYWEMAYAMARHGVMHGEFLMESSGEGLLLFTRIEPWLEQYRQHVGNPLAFRNAEWVAKETELGRQIAERFRKRVRAHLDAAKAATS